MALGYEGNLFILAFDHRGSFQKKMFGIEGDPTAEETETISDAKTVISEGFQKAVERGGRGDMKDVSGLLVDEQYGADIARNAKKEGLLFAMPVEKSGQDEFDFRYNPDGDTGMNERQSARLKRLCDWLHDADRKFLFELLVPAEEAQLESVGGDTDRYDKELRPELMLRTIEELQAAGINPDIWKIEGIDKREDCERIAEQTRSGGRDKVVCVVLGRGANDDAVDHWLRQGAGVPGYVGFAIGRTIWWDALKGYLDKSLDRGAAADQIAENYLRFIDVYAKAETAS
jgi:myo-inositol catabolism protein IolC